MKPRALIHIFTLLAFLISSFGTVSIAQARVTAVGGAGLEFAKAFSVSKPGTMVQLSPAFNSPVLKGIKVHPENPFRFDFNSCAFYGMVYFSVI